ncbi:hypothetical protein QE152_g328 [Popillia japonica]|uniref:Peptidase aspartic putative domain-containing protein n=1 Tax=Popillia japonica TaxID=7064 RepID=A0AAW1NC13_POPJA
MQKEYPSDQLHLSPQLHLDNLKSQVDQKPQEASNQVQSTSKTQQNSTQDPVRTISCHSVESATNQTILSTALVMIPDVRNRKKQAIKFSQPHTQISIANTRQHCTSRSTILSALQIPDNIVLADPQFYNSSKIDLLLGAGIFYDLLLSGRIRETTLGWIAGGQTCSTNNRQDSEHSVCKLTLEKQMELFWKIEELDETRNWSKEEQECEDHFVENFRRQPTGEFIVKLPFNHNKQKIGESKTVALKRFLTQEQRILHNKAIL